VAVRAGPLWPGPVYPDPLGALQRLAGELGRTVLLMKFVVLARPARRNPPAGEHSSPTSRSLRSRDHRVARDRPFGLRRARSAFRAEMNVPSTPALHPFGVQGPRRSRPRRTWLRRGERGMRWPLAPGGLLSHSLRSCDKPHLAALAETSRGAGWVASLCALSLAPQGALTRRRERERVDDSVGRCRRRTAMLVHRGVGRVSAFRNV